MLGSLVVFVAAVVVVFSVDFADAGWFDWLGECPSGPGLSGSHSGTVAMFVVWETTAAFAVVVVVLGVVVDGVPA
jgi:hypothetical protein